MGKWGAFAIALICAAWTAAGAIVPESPPDTSAPAYIYAVQCAGCHGATMEGGQFGPSLKGAAFVARWKGKDAELLKYIAAEMPPKAGGSLTPKEYAAVSGLLTEGVAASAQNIEGELPDHYPVSGDLGPRRAPEGHFHDKAYHTDKSRQQALLVGITPVTPKMLRSPPDGAWLSWRRTHDAQGFSPLKQIDRTNAKDLRLKWSWSVKNGRNEIAPIVHDGVIFINSANDVEALDAATGNLLWRYTRDIPPEHRGPLKMVQRSIAISGRTLLVPTADRHLVALDVSSGKVVWDTEVVPASAPEAVLSSGPLVAGHILVQGVSLGPMCPGGCYAAGIDAATGKILWRFSTIAKPGMPGNESWNNTPPEERTGGAIWNTASYDAERDIVYVGTGSTYDITSLLKPNTSAPGQTSDALYMDSTIALKGKTGKLLWYHQHLPRDVWDLDEAFERTLMTLPLDGRERELVVTIGKLGILDALDRVSGKYAFSIDLGLNNLVTSIDPITGRRTIDPAKYPGPNQTVEVCPSVQGARNWMATAFNPNSRVLYIPMQEVCMDLTWVHPAPPMGAKINMGWLTKAPPGSDGNYGRMVAVDLVTRKPVWTNRMRALPSSSLLLTAGGVLFNGSTDRTFGALDETTGKTLWETRLSSAPNATPVTFTVDGKQYVAIATGGGGDNESQLEAMTPEVASSAPATTLWVFGL